MATFFLPISPCCRDCLRYNVDIIDRARMEVRSGREYSMDVMMMVSSEVVGQVFGASVRQVRKSQGMKQVVLAEAVGYSRTRMSEIENGDLPPFEKAVSIAHVLGVSLDRLLYPLLGSPESGPAPTFLQRLLQLSPHDQRQLVEIFQVLLDEMKLVVTP